MRLIGPPSMANGQQQRYVCRKGVIVLTEQKTGHDEYCPKIETFNRELDALGREREESIYLLYRETDLLGKMVPEDIATFQQSTLEKLSGELPDFHRQLPGKAPGAGNRK